MQAYLQVDKVKGQVTESEHKEWIYIHSFNFGVQNQTDGDPSQKGKLVGGAVSYDNITVSKDNDITSPLLASMCSTGAPVAKVVIHVCEDSSKVEPVLVLELVDCLITNVSVNTGGKLRDSVTFAFSKITMTCTSIDQQGKKGASNKYTYDLLQKKLA